MYPFKNNHCKDQESNENVHNLQFATRQFVDVASW